MPVIRSLLLALLALTPLTAKSPHADQTDPRLEELFSSLLLLDDPNLLRATENRIWEIWLEHDNPDVERLMARGTESMNRGQYRQAMLVFNQLIAAVPNYAEAWNKRATLHYILGNLEASIEDIERTLALEPRHFGALSGLGLVHVQRRELQQAQQAFERLIEVHPNSVNAQENLERVLEELRLGVI